MRAHRPRVADGTLLVAILLLTLLLATRAVSLMHNPTALLGAREREFFGWAYREARVGEVAREVEGLLVPGEPVVVAIDRAELGNASWWRFQLSYWLTENPVLAVRPRMKALAEAPPDAAVVAITAERTVTLLRQSHGR